MATKSRKLAVVNTCAQRMCPTWRSNNPLEAAIGRRFCPRRKPAMKTLLLATALACSLAGFATPSQAFKGPSGQEIHSAKCSHDPSGCYDQASQACGGGSYQIIDSDSHAGGLLADFIPGRVTWYGMTFTCGRSDGRLASFPFRGQAWAPGHSASCFRWGNFVNCSGN